MTFGGDRPSEALVSVRPEVTVLQLLLTAMASLVGAGLLLASLPLLPDSSPLALFGGFWLLLGVTGLFGSLRAVTKIRLVGSTVEFVAPGGMKVVPAYAVIEFRRVGTGRNLSLKVFTDGHGTFRVRGPTRGLVDFLVQLRSVNPSVKFDDI